MKILKRSDYSNYFMDIQTILNIGMMVIFNLFALFLLVRIGKYLRNQLRIAPQKTFLEKLRVYGSIGIFSAVLTAVVVFIAAIISTSLAANAKNALNIVDSTFWGSVIKAFSWPNLLPNILIALGIYIVIYPFFESLSLARGGQDGAMEFQRWLENNIIDRFRPPFSYLVALIGFILVYIGPPTLISYFMIKTTIIPTTAILLFVFLDWFMIVPVMYLSYYSTIGSSQAWFTGLKANLKKDRKRLIVFIFAILMMVSTLYNVINSILIITGVSNLEPTLVGETGGFGGFIQTIVEYFMRLDLFGTITEKNWTDWNRFISIVPLDFLAFFVFTCLFGILGFYSKFLNKEPLNRPITVVFAAYIVSGLAFQIFGNILIKWPWVLEDAAYIRDVVDLSNPNSTETIIFMWFFFPAVAVEKILTAIFLVYQLFFNKNLRETINESILTQAIADKDVKVLKKYTNYKNSRIRQLVGESITHIVEAGVPEELNEYIEIIEELILDNEPIVVEAITPAIKLISFNIPVKKLFKTIQIAFGTEKESTIAEIEKVVIEIGKFKPESIQPLYEKLYSGYVPDIVKKPLMNILHVLGEKFPELSYNIGMPMLDRKINQVRKGAMSILKNLLNDFRPKFEQIYTKMKSITMDEKDPLRPFALEIMGYIASKDKDYIDRFLSDYIELEKLSHESQERIIGALSQIIISYPERMDEIINYLIDKLNVRKTSLIIKQDIIISLGVIAMELSLEQYFAKIHPNFEMIYHSKSEQLKESAANTFKFLFKVRTDLLDNELVKNLLSRFMIDDSSKVREIMYDSAIDLDRIDLFINALKVNNRDQITAELLVKFDEFLVPSKIGGYSEEYITSIYNTLISLNSDNSAIRLKMVELILKLSEQSKNITESSYPFLSSILRGSHDESSAKVISHFGKLCIKVKENPDYYSFELNFQDYYNSLKSLLENFKINKRSHSILAILKVFQKFYNIDNSLFDEVYEIVYKLKDLDNITIKPIIIEIISQIACLNRETFYKTVQDDSLLENVVRSKLESEVIPIIKDNFNSSDEGIQKAVIEAIKQISMNFMDNRLIRFFLFSNIRKKRIDTYVKIVSMECLTKYENVEIRFDIITKLKKQLLHSNSKIREAALRDLAIIMLKFESIENYDEAIRKKYNNAFKIIKRAILRKKFIKDVSINVRTAFIEMSTKIAIKFPQLNQPMLLVKDFAMDENKTIAILAIKSYFTYIRAHPKMIEKTAGYIRFFTNTDDISVKLVLLNQIIQNYKTGEELKFYLPALLKLAIDKDTSVRKKSLIVFKEIYQKATEKLLYFMELLIKLTRDKDPRIKLDSFELVAQLTFQFPKNMQQHNLVFDTFSRLSRDLDLSIKRVVSNYLEDLLKVYPEKLNNTLSMIYNLFREKDRTIISNCTNTLRYVILLYPDRKKDIISVVNKVYRKSANAILQSFIKEFS